MKDKFDEKLLQLKRDNGLCFEVACSEEENQEYMELIKQKKLLPKEIIRKELSNGNAPDRYYKEIPIDISQEELQEYCMLKQTKNINTIKNCVVFFTVLTVISLVRTVISFLPVLFN